MRTLAQIESAFQKLEARERHVNSYFDSRPVTEGSHPPRRHRFIDLLKNDGVRREGETRVYEDLDEDLLESSDDDVAQMEQKILSTSLRRKKSISRPMTSAGFVKRTPHERSVRKEVTRKRPASRHGRRRPHSAFVTHKESREAENVRVKKRVISPTSLQRAVHVVEKGTWDAIDEHVNRRSGAMEARMKVFIKDEKDVVKSVSSDRVSDGENLTELFANDEVQKRKKKYASKKDVQNVILTAIDDEHFRIESEDGEESQRNFFTRDELEKEKKEMELKKSVKDEEYEDILNITDDEGSIAQVDKLKKTVRDSLRLKKLKNASIIDEDLLHPYSHVQVDEKDIPTEDDVSDVGEEFGRGRGRRRDTRGMKPREEEKKWEDTDGTSDGKSDDAENMQKEEFYFLYVKIKHKSTLEEWRFDVHVTDLTEPNFPPFVFRDVCVNSKKEIIFHEPDVYVMDPVGDFGWVEKPVDLYGHTVRIQVFGVYPRYTSVVDSRITFGRKRKKDNGETKRVTYRASTAFPSDEHQYIPLETETMRRKLSRKGKNVRAQSARAKLLTQNFSEGKKGSYRPDSAKSIKGEAGCAFERPPSRQLPPPKALDLVDKEKSYEYETPANWQEASMRRARTVEYALKRRSQKNGETEYVEDERAGLHTHSGQLMDDEEFEFHGVLFDIDGETRNKKSLDDENVSEKDDDIRIVEWEGMERANYDDDDDGIHLGDEVTHDTYETVDYERIKKPRRSSRRSKRSITKKKHKPSSPRIDDYALDSSSWQEMTSRIDFVKAPTILPAYRKPSTSQSSREVDAGKGQWKPSIYMEPTPTPDVRPSTAPNMEDIGILQSDEQRAHVMNLNIRGLRPHYPIHAREAERSHRRDVQTSLLDLKRSLVESLREQVKHGDHGKKMNFGLSVGSPPVVMSHRTRRPKTKS